MVFIKELKFVSKTVQKYGAIDILVSNAATNPSYGEIFDVFFPH